MLIKETALVRLLSLKIPVLLFLAPRVVELDDAGCAVMIALCWRSRNHLGSMYFGALCAGADLAGGLNAARLIHQKHRRVGLIFADVRGEFLKRADGDVLFRSRAGHEIAQAVLRADETGERVTLPIEVLATVPDKYGDEPVARFTLGLSLKKKTSTGERTEVRGEDRASAGMR